MPLDLLEKASSDGAIDNSMIGGKTHGHHRADRDAFAVGDDTRRHLANSEDGALRRVDDRDKVINAKHTEIGDRESTTFVI